MLGVLDSANGGPGGGDAGPAFFGLMIVLGRKLHALQQTRQGDCRQHQGDDDHSRRQEDRQIPRRHGRAVCQIEGQRQYARQGDRAAHPGQRHDRHQPQADLGRRAAALAAKQGQLQRRPHPDKTQYGESGDDGEDIDSQPPDLAVLGGADHLGRAGHDGRHLLA